ncbi:MAG: tRNA CCA-pyrophosphorylase [Chloroflexi bacterium]|nr:tRNA CCA-pyrophosphorylase [Chloroflexota bacterium]
MTYRKSLQPLQILKLLPRTNCKECGSSTCFAFAFELLSRQKIPRDCPHLLKEVFAGSFESLEEALGAGERIEGTDLVVDHDRCTGCGDCVVICERALTTISIGGRITHRDPLPPVLQVTDGNVNVINWSSCKRSARHHDLCKVCEEKCPFGAIVLVS